jgi:hypothetical protein
MHIVKKDQRAYIGGLFYDNNTIDEENKPEWIITDCSYKCYTNSHSEVQLLLISFVKKV